MARRPGYRVAFEESRLESRRLLSRNDLTPVPAVIDGTAASPVPFPLFHHDGINGLILHRSFVDQLNDRLTNSSASAARVTQAFRAFEASESQLPVSPPPGDSGPTLASLLAALEGQVDYALTVRQGVSDRPSPSVAKSIKVSPLAPQALVPYANEQISQLGATLAATPPVPGPDGTPVTTDPTPALNQAINAIFNALAESSIHPNLFRSPSDFYISPNVQFTIDSTGAPADSSPGFFVRGPHGVILPGAPPRPALSR